MQQRINIYINKELRKQAKKICMKYSVSLSTLVDVLIMSIMKNLNKTKEISTKVYNEYLYKTDFKDKTSVKPKILDKEGMFRNANKSKIATNCIKLYLYKELYKVMQMETVSRCYSEIDKELTERYDPYAYYNENMRSIVKMIRENPNYIETLKEGKYGSN